jgi:hypothetical protein
MFISLAVSSATLALPYLLHLSRKLGDMEFLLFYLEG